MHKFQKQKMTTFWLYHNCEKVVTKHDPQRVRLSKCLVLLISLNWLIIDSNNNDTVVKKTKKKLGAQGFVLDTNQTIMSLFNKQVQNYNYTRCTTSCFRHSRDLNAVDHELKLNKNTCFDKFQAIWSHLKPLVLVPGMEINHLPTELPTKLKTLGQRPKNHNNLTPLTTKQCHCSTEN